MFQIERFNKIKETLLTKKVVDVQYLSDTLRVSEVTVRRDLEKLEQDGFLQRTRGGAILLETEKVVVRTNEDIKDQHYNHYIPQISEASKIIGEIAGSLVENHDVIFLGKGSESIALAKALENKVGVIVVTNYLPILFSMNDQRKNRVILAGGEVDYDGLGLNIGELDSLLGRIHIQKAFLPIKGVDIIHGYTVNDRDDLLAYQILKKTSKQIIALVESQAFEKIGLIALDDLTQISAVVTEDNIPDKYKIYYHKEGIALNQHFNLNR